MESAVSCREPFTRTELFDCLTDTYRCFLTGSCPTRSPADVAGMIFTGVCELVPMELTCISVTLVDKMIHLMSKSPPPEVSVFCAELLRVLFQDMDLMSQLVHQFQTEDQIISHLAAKSVSTCAVYHLHKSGTISPVWHQKCVQAFHNSPPGAELDACLWSLTEVLKRLLKAADPVSKMPYLRSDIEGTTNLAATVALAATIEILERLLAAFDSSLSALCSKFLPEERKEEVDFTSSSRSWGTTFCLLLDLLEALTVSTSICGAGLRSQRLTHIHSSALLTTIGSTSEYFVKKRALLLLKRAVLQKAGEDWALGEVPSTVMKHEDFSSDMNMLAQTVLTAVDANWLQSVQVESASFFGGTRHIRGDEGQKPDCVMLRAVSLLLLKSMELHIQTAGRTAGVDSSIEVHGYLQSLWSFLGRCSLHLMEVTHSCSWVSLLFGEQDDDMTEAAKALLSIFLHHRLCSGLDEFAVLEAACSSGCNPHCHFLLLLQSISFDHSILLDFLISAETCFLEYFVRYLKYLKSDWQGFTAACERVCMSGCHFSPQESITPGDMSALTYKGESDHNEFSSCVQPTGVPPVERISAIAGLRLVEYDSSDESDPGSMEISEVEPGVSVCQKSQCTALDVKQENSGPPVFTGQKQYESSESTGLLRETNSTLEGGPGGLSLPLLQSKKTSSTNMAPLSGHVTGETSARAVLCLSELREVVTRLQTKKLFPYNPSSLLKLLVQVENCSHQSHLSQFNK